MKRCTDEFKWSFLSYDEQRIMKEVEQIGINNFVETTMSLKNIEVKKHLDFVTREFLSNNMLNKVWSYMTSKMFEYFFYGKGDLKMLLKNLNR